MNLAMGDVFFSFAGSTGAISTNGRVIYSPALLVRKEIQGLAEVLIIVCFESSVSWKSSSHSLSSDFSQLPSLRQLFSPAKM